MRRRNAALSGDGRAVVFDSHTTNLRDGDTNSRVDVLHHGLTSRQTVRVGGAGNGDSLAPSTNHNERLVAFSARRSTW